MCDYLKNTTGSKIFDIVLPTMRKYLTIDPDKDLSCPFVGRFDIRNFPINGALLLNMFVPVGDYMVNLTSFTNNEYIWNGRFFFNIPEGKTIEDDRMG